MKNLPVIVVAVSVIAGGVGFFGGMQYQKSNTVAQGPGGQMRDGSFGERPDGAVGMNGGVPGMAGGGVTPVSGEIVDVDDSSITVQTRDGGNKIVIYSGSTTVNTTTEGSAADLVAGEEIMVIGTEGDNDTITAETISIGSTGFRGGMPEDEPEME